MPSPQGIDQSARIARQLPVEEEFCPLSGSGGGRLWDLRSAPTPAPSRGSSVRRTPSTGGPSPAEPETR